MTDVKHIGITALGMYVPERTVTNADFEGRMGMESGWIESRSGIRERRFAAPGEFTSTLGVRAVQDMLRRDPEALSGVDLLGFERPIGGRIGIDGGVLAHEFILRGEGGLVRVRRFRRLYALGRDCG